MKKVSLLFALLLFPLIAFYGCSGSGLSLSTGTDSPSVGSITNGGSITNVGSITKTGELLVSANFPKNGQKGEIGAALIDANTASIKIQVYAGGKHYTHTLTPQNPNGRISDIPVGSVTVYIYTYDSSDKLLDYLVVGGKIVEGQNTLTATLIRGSWQFVDANGKPTTITLNKTLSSDQTTLSSFSLIPLNKSTMGTHETYRSWYNLLWKGSFTSRLCGATESKPSDTCLDELFYYNEFTGPSTNKNVVESDTLPLQPTLEYNPTPDNPTNRTAFIFGVEPTHTKFSDPDVLNYANSRVTGPDIIEGHIIEVLFKSFESTIECYTLTGTKITCPLQMIGGASKSSLTKAVSKAISQRVGKAAPNAQGCFINLSGTGTYEWEHCDDLDKNGKSCECTDIDNDKVYCEEGEKSPDDWFKVKEVTKFTVDACGYPFKAKGSQLPTTDLNLIIQKN